jgi:hypothetical protein
VTQGGRQPGGVQQPLELAEAKKDLGSNYNVREKVMSPKSMILYMHNVLHI